MIIEAVAAKVAFVVKGAVAVAAHQGLTASVAQQFASMIGSAGLVAALHWLVATLSAAGATVVLLQAIERLIVAIEHGRPLPAIEAAADIVAGAFRK
ncbi:hypothetical protein [Actinokineospora sp. NBRC 105648]|uniref:hypothetical protein n=1 Tax=Actinokineospora sp. NBRC 105648 TaxID=3032206 RepID=UPI0024A0907A|nr:hypothetical protein [Actinokineospora sp. NBRC 105648]GLZ38126.1 hypothetical protein Acsp05_17500 [Actinokineospora sp. NBRC 105648]